MFSAVRGGDENHFEHADRSSSSRPQHVIISLTPLLYSVVLESSVKVNDWTNGDKGAIVGNCSLLCYVLRHFDFMLCVRRIEREKSSKLLMLLMLSGCNFNCPYCNVGKRCSRGRVGPGSHLQPLRPWSSRPKQQSTPPASCPPGCLAHHPLILAVDFVVIPRFPASAQVRIRLFPWRRLSPTTVVDVFCLCVSLHSGGGH